MGISSYLVKNSKEYQQLEQQYRALAQQHQELVKRTSHILDAEESTKRTRQILRDLEQKYNAALARYEELCGKIAAMEQD